MRAEVRSTRIGCAFHRWYTPATGRYSRTDPLGRNGDPHPYLYALANPLNFIDPLGLKVRVCCKAIPPTLYGSVAVNIQYGLNTKYKRHCYFEFGDGSTVGLHGPTDVLGVLGAVGCKAQSEIQRRQRGQGGFDQRTDLPTNCGPWAECADDCVNEAVESYPNPTKYCLFGPNSNSFTGSIERKCPVKPPPASEIRNAPGWYDGPPS